MDVPAIHMALDTETNVVCGFLAIGNLKRSVPRTHANGLRHGMFQLRLGSDRHCQ